MGPSAIGYHRSTCRANPRNEVLFLRVRCQTLPCSGPPRPPLECSKLRCQLSARAYQPDKSPYAWQIVSFVAAEALSPTYLVFCYTAPFLAFFSNYSHGCSAIRFFRCRRSTTPDVRRDRLEVVRTFATSIIFLHSLRQIPFIKEGKVASTADRRTVLAADAGA